MTGDPKIYSSLEEEIYWSQFRVVQFLQRVSANSDDGLVLPKNFVKNLRENLGSSVILKTPSGAQWVMDLGRNADGDGSLSLKGTWKEFAEAHKLQKDDTLIFKYYGNSEFDVTMFDGKTGCEKVCGYFVRKEVNPSRTRSDVKNNTRGDTSRTHCDVQNGKDKKNRGDGDCEFVSSHDKDTVTSDDSAGGRVEKKRKGKSFCDGRTRGWISGATARSQLGVNFSKEGERNASEIKIKQERAEEKCNGDKPKLRIATQLDKQRTLERASEELSENGLLVVMRSTYVSPRFRLVVPVKWARSQGLKKTQEVELRTDGNSWRVTFFYWEASNAMIMDWKAFVFDNGLEKDDVCLFDVVSGSQSPVIINVRIFRVTDHI